MKIDKLILDNGKAHIVLDTRTGEFLEIYSCRNHDNVIKNLMDDVAQPFRLCVLRGEESKKYTRIPIHDVANRPEYHVDITTQENGDEINAKIKYNAVWDGEKIVPADLFYTIKLKGYTIAFDITINWIEEGSSVKEVQFPIIPGVWLGESYEDDTLIYPRDTGVKIANPVNFFGREIRTIQSRWTEYKYTFSLDTLSSQEPRFKEFNANGYSGKYANGRLCMSWVDLYDKDGGMYFGCHNEDYRTCIIDVWSRGEKRPGLTFTYAYEMSIKKGESYVSPKTEIFFHEGDWHKGAKYYREFRLPQIEVYENRFPSWMKDGAGLVAHYDFMYQNGNIEHKYTDIPRLAKEAKEMGMNYLLLAGWHKDGFDKGYPEYYADPKLGTEEELAEGIKKANEMGVHVSFYMNSHLHRGSADSQDVKDKAVMFEDGKYKQSFWGNVKDIILYNMCSSCKEWQDQLKGLVLRASDVYGIDGIYLDVFSVGQALCFNPKHNHADPDNFTEGNLQIAKSIRDEYDAKHKEPFMMMGEHVCDLVGGIMTLQLNQYFMSVMRNGHPNVYRYTFPEHGIIDMVYPGKNLFLRPAMISKKWEIFMGHHFTNGSYFWAYDLERDATFKTDPEGMAVLKELIKMKKIMNTKAEGYLFADEDDISCSNKEVFCKRFIHKYSQKSMLAVYRISSEQAVVDIGFGGKKAVALLPDGTQKKIKIKKGKMILPDDKICLIFID